MSGRHALPTARVSRMLRARVLAAITVLVLVLALTAVTPKPEITEAAWADAESSVASLSATRLPTPVLVNCKGTNVLGIVSVTIDWTLDSELPSNSEYNVYGSKSLLSLISGVSLLGGVSTTGPSATGTCTTTYSGGLLSNTLGGTVYVGFDITTGANWRSNYSYAKVEVQPVVGIRSCTLTNNVLPPSST